MLSQHEADALMNLVKMLVGVGPTITFPAPGETLLLQAKGITTSDTFNLDVNRKGGRIKKTKITYQTRFGSTILIRVDIDGPPHLNPDGERVLCPHIHLYVEGCGDAWAFPLDEKLQTDPSSLPQVLIDFFTYNTIVGGIPPIQDDGGDLV